MAKIVYGQMPPAPPRELPQMPRRKAKPRMQKPQGGGKFLVQIAGSAGGIVMDEIDTCINKLNDLILNLTPENMTQHSGIE